jgi:hypothetical protein
MNGTTASRDLSTPGKTETLLLSTRIGGLLAVRRKRLTPDALTLAYLGGRSNEQRRNVRRESTGTLSAI